MAIVTYPLNDIDFTAEDVGIYNATRTSGIYAGDDFAISVTGSDNTVSIDEGLAWMHLSRFLGVAVALKNKVFIDLGIPDSVYSRIDAVVLQFDANKNGTEVVVKSGSASSNPLPPAVSRTEALYELHLLHVLRKPGATSITAVDVTDLRLNAQYCGLMADAVTSVDTAAIDAQITALIQKLREDLKDVEENTYFVSKNYVDTKRRTAVLRSSGWSASAPYVQSVTVADLTDQVNARAYPDIVEDATQAAALAEEKAKISDSWRSGNQMTFRCLEEKPELDIPVIVEVYV